MVDIVILDTIFNEPLFEWLTLYRPVSEFRIAGFSLRERLERLYGRDSIYVILKDGMQAKIISKRHNLITQELPSNDFIVVNSGLIASFSNLDRFIAQLSKLEVGTGFYRNGVLLAAHLNKEYVDSYYKPKIQHRLEAPPIDLYYMKYPWNIFMYQEDIIKDDILSKFVREEYSILKSHRGSWPVLVSKNGVFVERFVYFDTRNGPIILCESVEIEAFSRISGPCIIRERSKILSALVRGNTAIGPVCKVGGEIEASLIDGYSNKSHESFLGHSYVGEWVNLGAHTVTSDLKNTYGPVRVRYLGETFETGLIKVGAFIGDHVKTAIGTQIFAGKVIGVFSHVMGLVSINIPPFTIWNGYKSVLYELNPIKASEIQMRMYGRRGIKQLDEERKYIKLIFESTLQYRLDAVKGRVKI